MRTLIAATVLAGLGIVAMPADAAPLSCKMTYALSGWSVIYKQTSGSGKVTCSDGTSMTVKLSAKGGGLTVGKFRIDDGSGKFSDVKSIRDVLGTYAAAEADAAAGKAADAQVMSKGPVSLALSGKGTGWNLGISFTGFTISEK